MGDSITGGADDDTLLGNGGNDYLGGNAGNDQIYGGEGSDYIQGGDNDDLIQGNGGNDSCYGDNGNDRIVEAADNGADGSDVLQGNAGIDTVDYSAYTANVAISPDGVANDGPTQGEIHDVDNAWDFEVEIGGSGNDVIVGNGGANTLVGNGGNDVLTGNGGADSIGGGGARTWPTSTRSTSSTTTLRSTREFGLRFARGKRWQRGHDHSVRALDWGGEGLGYSRSGRAQLRRRFRSNVGVDIYTPTAPSLASLSPENG